MFSMKKWLLPAILMILFPYAAFSQTQLNTITGSVTDKENKPLAGANVVLLNLPDKSLAKAEVTDKNGSFRLENLKPGKYKLQITFLGLQTHITDSLEIASDMEIPVIALQEKAKTLQEVTVQSQKPLIEIRADRLIVNVENSIVNTGSTILEVLGRSPGVKVDQADNISLKGKQGINIMIDGKNVPVSGTDLANILKSMPASSVEKIEIITNPGARYDAAGSAGIINIKTKKDKRLGMNGSLNASYGQGIYYKANAGLNINYRSKKINVNASYNYSDRQGFSHLSILRHFYNNNGDLMTTYNQENHTFFPVKNHTGVLGFDYYISPKTTVGIVASGNTSVFEPRGDNFSIVDSSDVHGFFTTTNRSHDNWKNYTLNGFIRHSFDSTGREISVDIDYARYWNTTTQTFTNRNYDSLNNVLPPAYILNGDLQGLTQIRSFKADYTHRLKSVLRLDAGIKSSFVTADNRPFFYDNSFGEMIYDTTKSNHFVYTEHINAAYVNASKDWDKWSAQFGLRAEQTRAEGDQKITGQKFTREYAQLFPSLAVQRKLNTTNDLGVTLSRRIDRPGYRQLNPFKFFLDPTNYRVGNPYLKPALTYAVEVSHTFKQRYVTSLNYSVTTDVAVETLEADTLAPNQSIQTDKNLSRQYYYGMSGAYPIQIRKWWSSVTNFNAYYTFFTGNLSNTPLRKGSPAFDINSSHTFTLPHGISAEIGFYYQAPMVWGFYEMRAIYMLNFGVQKSLLNKKATLKLGLSDLFRSSNNAADIRFNNFEERFTSNRDSRVLTLSFSYRFGKAAGQQRRRSSGVEDEKKRVGGAG
jgi:hypothetical protein